MKHFILILIAAIGFSSCTKTPDDLIKEPDCTPRGSLENTHQHTVGIELLLDKGIESGIPGIALSIRSASKGEFFATQGYANLDKPVALASCHVFRAASLTKTLIATAIIQLVDEKEIALDQLITELLPKEIWEGLAKANETTVGELLSHTSGIPNYDDNTRFVAAVLNEPGEELTVQERLDFAKELQSTPDWVIEKFRTIYSNTNYVLLELILEAQTGLGYEEYLRQNVLEPAEMLQSSFSTAEAFPKGLSDGYCDMYDRGSLREVNRFDARRWSGEAALISNVQDIDGFFAAFLSAKLCTDSSLEQMQEHQYGLLRDTIAGVPAIGHDGQAIGYSSEMWYFEDLELTIVLMANQGRISGDQPSIQPFEDLLEEIVKLHL